MFGAGALGGGQASLVAVPSADFQLFRIPDGMDDASALLLTDNLNTGWIGAKRADIPLGGTVAVLGLGAVGLCAVRSALRARGRSGVRGRPRGGSSGLGGGLGGDTTGGADGGSGA